MSGGWIVTLFVAMAVGFTWLDRRKARGLRRSRPYLADLAPNVALLTVYFALLALVRLSGLDGFLAIVAAVGVSMLVFVSLAAAMGLRD